MTLGTIPQYTAELANSISKHAVVFVICSKMVSKSYVIIMLIYGLFIPFNFTINNLR